MDIQRPASVARQKKMRRILFAAVGVIVIGVVSVVLARLKPAAPTVERATVWVDTVKRGDMQPQRPRPGHAGAGRRSPPPDSGRHAGTRRAHPDSARRRGDTRHRHPRAERAARVQQALSDAEQQLRGAEADYNSLAGATRERPSESALGGRHRRGRLSRRRSCRRKWTTSSPRTAWCRTLQLQTVDGPRRIARRAQQDRAGERQGRREQLQGAAAWRSRRASTSSGRCSRCGVSRSIS